MKTYSQMSKCLLLCLLSLMGAQVVAVSANSPSPEARALIESMEERLPELMKLKLKGEVGETNMGLVEARTDLEKVNQRRLANENQDRLAHYQLIAEKLGIAVKAVQSKRAEQIRENSPKGVWVETKSGAWHRK